MDLPQESLSSTPSTVGQGTVHDNLGWLASDWNKNVCTHQPQACISDTVTHISGLITQTVYALYSGPAFPNSLEFNKVRVMKMCHSLIDLKQLPLVL